jgi:uncharacterized phosphosugar-binding protein
VNRKPKTQNPKPPAISVRAPLDYLAAVRAILDHLEKTQLSAIERAADLVIHALTHKGAVWCAEIGHSTQNDFINRAGGLAAVQAFAHTFTVSEKISDALKDRPRKANVERDLEAIRLAVKTSQLRAGDVLLVGSVSGKNRAPVELALACRDNGIKVIGFTSLQYTAKVESLHPSRKKLCDVVDVVIDNGAPYGDAAVEIAGIEHKVLPISGVAMNVAGWMLWGRVMEKMSAAGNPPTTFQSINRAGGKAAYEKALAQYNQRGW